MREVEVIAAFANAFAKGLKLFRSGALTAEDAWKVVVVLVTEEVPDVTAEEIDKLLAVRLDSLKREQELLEFAKENGRRIGPHDSIHQLLLLAGTSGSQESWRHFKWRQ